MTSIKMQTILRALRDVFMYSRNGAIVATSLRNKRCVSGTCKYDSRYPKMFRKNVQKSYSLLYHELCTWIALLTVDFTK